jgi:NAD(P)-dependent dehydrogenase (short-subunit alcohol dehydrogenase family)
MHEPSSVVVVTGAGQGMGASHALLLTERGHRVVCLDRDAAAARAVAERCGERAYPVQADVTDSESLDRAVSMALTELGRIDAVVANAGITVGGATPTLEMAEADWQLVLDVNLTGVWRSIRAVVPAIIESGGGVVLAISSVAGLSGSPNWGAYAAAKHGVIGLVRSLANELAPHNIRCNAVCPGMVRTPMLYADAASISLAPADAEREFVAGHLFQRLIEPREISEVVAFLLSPAGSSITGQAVVADLGYLARTPGT